MGLVRPEERCCRTLLGKLYERSELLFTFRQLAASPTKAAIEHRHPYYFDSSLRVPSSTQ